MLKELILAVILGTLLGFGLTGGYLAIKKSSTNINTANITPVVTPQTSVTPTSANITPTSNPDPSTSTNYQVIIDSPQKESVVTNAQITIKGSAAPQSYLIISIPSKNYFTTADNAGNFNMDIDIDSGVNQITVTAIDQNDNQTSAQTIVTYSTTKF